MESLKITEIASAINGDLINCDINLSISNIAFKSWRVEPGDLYIALVNKDADFREPLERAINSGAKAVVLPKRADDYHIPQIIVENTWTALENLAKYYKEKFNLPTIMITGSYGKTSTKDMVASVLRQKYKVHKTQQNNNSNLGVPYTIFHMKGTHELSVLEVGMDNFDQIKPMANLVKPNIAIITNIGTAHLQNLRTKENILKAKMEITEYFNENNILIINNDDEYLSTIKDKPYRIIRVSTKGNGDYTAFDIVNLGEAGVQFKCKYRGETLLLRTSAVGVHNVYNALFAIAAADLFHLDKEEIRLGIIKFKPSDLRMNIIRLEDNITLIEDCYNASPDSMKSSLDVLSSFNEGRKIAVLGDMLELGDYSTEAHKDVGQYSIDKCNMLIAVGPLSKHIAEATRDYIPTQHFLTLEEASKYLEKIIKAGDTLLFKASRGMMMEKIVEYLTENKEIMP